MPSTTTNIPVVKPSEIFTSAKNAVGGYENIERECEAYSEHIFNILAAENNNELLRRYSLKPEESTNFKDILLKTLQDGVVLSYLINSVQTATVDISRLNRSVDVEKINKNHSKSLFELNENLNLCIESAKKLAKCGVTVVNLGANDVLEKNVDVVLGLVWQLIRASLVKEVNLVSHPALIRLLNPGETLQELMNMSAEKLLLRWVNYHLKAAKAPEISNFAQDLSDGMAYITLLQQITPDRYDHSRLSLISNDAGADSASRIKAVLEHAEAIECPKFVRPLDIINGNARLNFGFIAGLFNKYIGIYLPSNQELKSLYDKIDRLDAENADLKSKLSNKDNEITVLNQKFTDLQEQWKEYHSQTEVSTAKQIETLKSFYEEELEKLKKTFDDERRGHKTDIEQREKEYQGMVDAMTAKNKMNEYQMERQTEELKQKLARELLALRRSFDDFFLKNDPEYEVPPVINELEKLPEELRQKAIKCVEMYYEKLDSINTLEKKIDHMNHVNQVIGDKIQEFALSKARSEDSLKKKRNILDMFFRST